MGISACVPAKYLCGLLEKKKKKEGQSVQEGREYVHAAVGEGNRFRVAGHALLLAVVGAGGRSQSVAGVCIVHGLPTGCVSGEKKEERRRRGRELKKV